MKLQRKTLPVCWRGGTVPAGGVRCWRREGRGGSACLDLIAEAARRRTRSTLRPQRPLTAPSTRGAELRPATAHHSRLGTGKASTAPGAFGQRYMVTIPDPAAISLLQLH